MAKKGQDAKKEPGSGGFLRILKHSSTIDRVFMVIGTICAMGGGAILPVMNLIFGRLTDTFNNYFAVVPTITEDEFRREVSSNALILVYLFIAKFVTSYISTYSFRMTGIRISAALRLAYLDTIFNLPIADIDRLPPGAAIHTLTNIANTIQMAVSERLALLIRGISLILTAYVIAFVKSWLLTLVSTSAVVFLMLTMVFTVRYQVKFTNGVYTSNAKASAVADEILRGVKTIQSLNAEKAALKRHDQHVDAAQAQGNKLSLWVAAQFSPLFFVVYAQMALTFWAGIRFYSEGRLKQSGDLITVLFSVLLVVSGINTVVTPLQYITKAQSASRSCFEILDKSKLPPGGRRTPALGDEIYFMDVVFAYPGRPRAAILKGLNINIPWGKQTAIVGGSGCGKSTIVGLLEKWYSLSDINEDPQPEENDDKKGQTEQNQSTKSLETTKHSEKEGYHSPAQESIVQNSGTIYVGDTNIEAIDRKWWRSQIGLVQQEPVLLGETIYEAVVKGLIGSPWEDVSETEKREMVEKACIDAYAHDFIQQMDQGYDTTVGNGAGKLSGGQRQRLAIARSIIKKPIILILDEATSSIDVRSEKVVTAALERVSRGRTTIVISHRLSTIQKSDKIIVMKAGVAVEQGTHDELIDREDGAYSQLVKAQAQLGQAPEPDEGDDPSDDSMTRTDWSLDEGDTAVQDSRSHLGASEHGEEEADEEAPSKKKKPSVPDVERAISLPASVETDKVARRKSGIFSKLQFWKKKTAPEDEKHERGFLRALGFLLAEQKMDQGLYILIMMGAVVAGGAVSIQSWLFSHVIVVFQAPTLEEVVEQGNFWSRWLFVLSIGALFAYGVIGFCSNRLSYHISSSYRKQYFENVLRKPVRWFDDESRPLATITSDLAGDPQQLQEVLGPTVAFPFIAIFNLIGCTVLTFVFAWKLSLVIFFAALPAILLASFMRMHFEKSFNKMNEKVFAPSTKFASESISALRTVVSLTLEDSIIGYYRELIANHVHDAFREGRFSILVFALSDSLELCAMALAFWYGGQLMATREYSPIQFFIAYTAIIQSGQSAGQFLAIGETLFKATGATNRIINSREGLNAISDLAAIQPKQTVGLEIEFRNVAFRYPSRPKPVYNNLSFLINPGDYVAFVGPSGCGKTTVISLLETFYKVNGGEILIDGHNLYNLPLTQYRALCALVTQEPMVFEGSVRDNLTLGLPFQPSEAEIHEACKAATLHDFLISLPNGYQTQLSSGTHSSLSGGQKQRLCIARALLRRPRLLMLDEATNSLDSVSESAVQEAIEKVAAKKQTTIVVVAHRLATVKNADRIICLGEGGTILESGTNEELMGKKGFYWQMCNSQAFEGSG